MRSGDVAWLWVLLALTAGCERRASRRVDDRPSPASGASAPAAPVAPDTLGRQLPGCATTWWPLEAGQRWSWNVERRWVAVSGELQTDRAVVTTEVHAAGARDGRRRLVLDPWPEPWTPALGAALTVEVDGHAVRQVLLDAPGGERVRPWIDLAARTGNADDVERRVEPATAAAPATLELVWRSRPDLLTVRLACGVGPVLVEYVHHGTVEELRAVRVAAPAASAGRAGQ